MCVRLSHCYHKGQGGRAEDCCMFSPFKSSLKESIKWPHHLTTWDVIHELGLCGGKQPPLINPWLSNYIFLLSPAKMKGVPLHMGHPLGRKKHTVILDCDPKNLQIWTIKLGSMYPTNKKTVQSFNKHTPLTGFDLTTVISYSCFFDLPLYYTNSSLKFVSVYVNFHLSFVQMLDFLMHLLLETFKLTCKIFEIHNNQ